MTERLHFHFSLFTFIIGEGNGNPLQCSCLENPRDGGAWWASVYGVARSQTRLKQLSSSSSSSPSSSPLFKLLLYDEILWHKTSLSWSEVFGQNTLPQWPSWSPASRTKLFHFQPLWCWLKWPWFFGDHVTLFSYMCLFLSSCISSIFLLLQVFFFRSKYGNLWLFLLCVLIAQSCLTLCDPMICSSPVFSCPFPGKSTGVGCHFLLQGIFLTQGSNPGLLHCRQILYHLSHQGSPLTPVRFYVL